MNRLDLRLLAEARIDDARVLLAGNRWTAAYYLLGYAVECALKACVASQFRQEEVPDKRIVLDFYTHDLEKLLGLAGLKTAFDAKVSKDSNFLRYWKFVCDWDESSRYDHAIPEAKVRDLLTAVDDPISGVFTWLKTQW